MFEGLHNILKFIWEKFELLVRRVILPSSMFVVFLFIIHTGDNNFIRYINQEYTLTIPPYLLPLILILGTAYLLKILGQLLFDNLIKHNYNSWIYKKENQTLQKLRDKVIQKLQEDYSDAFKHLEYSDYLLYQIVGRVLSQTEFKTDTSRYVTDAKEASVGFVAFFLFVQYYLFQTFSGFLYILFALGITLLIFLLAYESIKAKYRSRAFRMYANFLLDNATKHSN